MKFFFLSLLILTIISETLGNDLIIKGKVTNQKGEGLQYVNIGIINKPIGTVTNKNGDFIFTLKQKTITTNDSVRFSIIGYYSKTIQLTKLINASPNLIVLTEKVDTLKEAIITSKRIQKKVKGTTHFHFPLYVGVLDSTVQDFTLGSAIARSFTINHNNTIIEKIRFFAYSDYDTVTIRLNIYSLKRKKPYRSILKKGVYQEILGKTNNWIEIDLRNQSIILSNDVIIALEWVGKSKKGSYLFFPLARPSLASHYYKQGSQNKWQRWPNMSCLMEITIKY